MSFHLVQKEVIFVVDPMCSWCWGFAPELDKLRASLAESVKFSLLLGGLRSSGDQEWSEEFKTYLQQHWNSVAKMTHQPFNKILFERENFDYNTEPACRAVVTVRELKGDTFSFLHALQYAFYAEGRDITDSEVLTKIALTEGINQEEFLSFFNSKRAKELTIADQYKVRSMGANSFPSLVVIEPNGHLSTIKGYKKAEELLQLI